MADYEIVNESPEARKKRDAMDKAAKSAEVRARIAAMQKGA